MNVVGQSEQPRMGPLTRILPFGQLLRIGAILGSLLSFFATGPLVCAQILKGSQAVLTSAGSFSPDLKPWIPVGQARFEADEVQSRHGHRAARITLGPDVTPNYQRLRQDFTLDIRPNDEFRASVWARSRDIKNARGPYLALEFLNECGQRLAIAHSGAVTGTDREGWEQLTAEATAPGGTFAARVSLVLHAHGTARFADPELIRTHRPIAWPDLGDQLRLVTIRGDQVIQPRFGGVGFHASPLKV